MEKDLKRRAWVLSSLVFIFAAVLFPLRTELLNPPERERIFLAPDMAAGWTKELLEVRFEPLSPNERSLYAISEITLDAAFPALYAALLILGLRLVWLGPATEPWRRLWRALIVFLPGLAAIFDLCENALLFSAASDFDWAFEEPAITLLRMVTTLKFALLLASVFLLVVAVAMAGRLGRTVALLWLARIPLLGLLALVMLAVLGGGDQVSQTIPNMMLMTGFLQMFLVAFLAGVLANSAGFSLMLIWDYGALRTGTPLPNLPLWVSEMSAGSAYRGAPLTVLALPLVVRAISRSVLGNGQSLVALLLAAVAGLGAALLLIPVIEQLRRLLKERANTALAEALRTGLFRMIGASGYTSEQGRLLPGHLLATAAVIVGVVLYFGANISLQPNIESRGAAIVPTLAYVLGLLSVLTGLLAGASFLFDRWRAPLVAVLVLWASFLGFLFPVRHEFKAFWRDAPLPTVGAAARARLDRQQASSKLLTVVTATGGGIQAAAWTARVLTGLDAALEGRLTPTIAVISSTSGGSVGAYFSLAAFTHQGGLDPALHDAVVAASEASSLEEAAWGFLFPDLRRAFLPFTSAIRDRAWAMEKGWMRARLEALGGGAETIKEERLSIWAERAARGELPAVVFNATRIEDGLPLRLTTVRGTAADGGSAVRGVLGLGAHPGYSLAPEDPGCSERAGYLDLSTATAARLSATFPYVSPITQPREIRGLECLSRWHAADGGYFDNHGTTGALSWLADLGRECSECLEGVERIVWLQIDPFPANGAAVRAETGGWVHSVAGPLLGLVRVRSGSQRVRRDQELALLERLEPRLHLTTFAPEAAGAGITRDQPLSWFLSPSDKARIERDWQTLSRGPGVEELRRVFGLAPKQPGRRAALTAG